mmetsp:Transcript_16950/g.42564  ORF Transcript_16950/g.42564 Transcript_16950/m.42564 type:complete len:179 (-) Transcript_16950:496-1032(-)
MAIRIGDNIAANVPLERNDLSWIVAKVIEIKDDGLSYVVKDEEEDKRYTVEAKMTRPFPGKGQSFEEGDQVLALWPLDSKSWTTLFYEAKVLQVLENGGRLRLSYSGDRNPKDAPTEKVLHKYPKKRTLSEERKMNGTPVQNSYKEQYDNRPAKKVKCLSVLDKKRFRAHSFKDEVAP